MKKTRSISYVLFFCYLILGYSCIDHHQHTTELLDIQSAFDNSPYQALERLYRINPHELTKKEHALYCLILTEGQFKIDSLPPSDSIINIAIKYYKTTNDSLRLSQSLYYKGKIYQQKKFLIQAVECYHKARKHVGQNHIEVKLLLNQDMGKIYHFKMMREEEKEAKENALRCAKLLNDSLLIGQSLIELSKYYNITDSLRNSKKCLKQALSTMPTYYSSELALIQAELCKIHLSTHLPDSALHFINQSISIEKDSMVLYDYYNLKADAFYKLALNDSAKYYFMRSLQSHSLRTKITTYYDLFKLEEKYGKKDMALSYLKAHVQYRDSLDKDRKEAFVDRLQNIEAYKREKRNARMISQELSHNKMLFYRVVIATLIIIFFFIILFYKDQKKKRKLKQEVKEKEEKNMLALIKQKEIENKLLKEKEERKKEEIRLLNLTVDYYKRLNAITVPILLKSQNKQGAMHLKEEEWEIIIKNTDACFNQFTTRIKTQFPQLTDEEVRLCCLIKMEISISLLSEIYHIARTSISRKKVRLKEKMGIEDMIIDDYIRNF